MLRSINQGSWLEVSSVLNLEWVFMKLESHLRAKMHH
jgi:hypothetical protein